MTLLAPAPRDDVQGIIVTVKEGYGFIERVDLDEQIFFHFSEFERQEEYPRIGDEVSFVPANRRDKDVATRVRMLPPGTVKLEDVSAERCRGTVLRALKRFNRRPSSTSTAPLPTEGAILVTHADGSTVEVAFRDKDGASPKESMTSLRVHDVVEMNITTELRTGRQRATGIVVLEHGVDPAEKREQGVIASVKEGFGFIKCADRDTQLFFHFSEVLDAAATAGDGPGSEIPREGDEVEFVVRKSDSGGKGGNRQLAARIKRLLAGTVRFESVSEEVLHGTVVAVTAAKRRESSSGPGQQRQQQQYQRNTLLQIVYENDGETRHVSFDPHDAADLRASFYPGDSVEFSLRTQHRTQNQRKLRPASCIYYAEIILHFSPLHLILQESPQVYFIPTWHPCTLTLCWTTEFQSWFFFPQRPFR